MIDLDTERNGAGDEPADGMIPRHELRRIRSAISWGESIRARRAAKDAGEADDNDAVTRHAMYYAARRLGLTSGDLDSFLDSVRMEDMIAVSNEPRDFPDGTT